MTAVSVRNCLSIMMKNPPTVFSYFSVMDTYSFGYSSAGFNDMPMNHNMFLAQFDAIKKLAGEGPCVMVGRCADYALSDWPDCLVFLFMLIWIQESEESRPSMERVTEKQKIS